MLKTQGVSFPRSGHGLLYRVLKYYFGSELVYCDPHSTSPGKCSCGSVPCINPANTFAKNHDFGLHNGPGLDIVPDRRYLIQYRSPIRAIASNFHLHIARYPDKNTYYEWVTFAYRQIEYWNDFMDKWVLEREKDPRFLLCSYEQVLSDPNANIRRVIEHMSEKAPDMGRMQKGFDKVQIRPLNNLAAFRFYDEEFFRRLEVLTESRMARLNLPSFDQGV